MPPGRHPPFRIAARPAAPHPGGSSGDCMVRQLADKEGRLCCRNRGRAWRSRSAAAHRRSGTAPRLAACRLGALAVNPSRPAAGIRPLRWPRPSAPPARRAWPWPPPPRSCRDAATSASAGSPRRVRGRNGAVRSLSGAGHRVAAGRAAAHRRGASVSGAWPITGYPLAAGNPAAIWSNVVGTGCRAAADVG